MQAGIPDSIQIDQGLNFGDVRWVWINVGDCARIQRFAQPSSGLCFLMCLDVLLDPFQILRRNGATEAVADLKAIVGGGLWEAVIFTAPTGAVLAYCV